MIQLRLTVNNIRNINLDKDALKKILKENEIKKEKKYFMILRINPLFKILIIIN